jgi:hypothetical protein
MSQQCSTTGKNTVKELINNGRQRKTIKLLITIQIKERVGQIFKSLFKKE